MTDDELKDIELDHEGVHHAQGWTVKVVLDDGTTAKVELTPEALPLDLKRCVDAVPKLLEGRAQLKGRLSTLWVASCKACVATDATTAQRILQAGRCDAFREVAELLGVTLVDADLEPRADPEPTPEPLDEFDRERLKALKHKSHVDKLAGGVACTSVAEMEERWALEARERLS